MKVVNHKGGNANDIRQMTPESVNGNHAGGRRQGGGSGVVGTPKHRQLHEARSTSLANKRAFRAGTQDARKGGREPGPQSPSALQVKTRRRGSGSMHISPPAHVE